MRAFSSKSKAAPQAAPAKPTRQGRQTVQAPTAATGVGQDFSLIQTKLAINKPGDKHEQEADRIAEQVVGTPAPIAQTITPLIQAKGSGGATASEAVTTEIAATRGGGSPLPASSKQVMENRFGTDFSRVRVHTGDYAARMSRDLHAKAFTVGSDIYFNNGTFSPESQAGKHLLAHELTHTVQQGAAPKGAQLAIQKADGDKASTPFGDFVAEKYHALKKTSDGKEVGVEMFLKFNPGPKVDAKQIAMTQAATGKISGTTAAQADPNYGRRSATAGAGQGQFIDVLPGYPSPLYATDKSPTAGADASKLTSYPTVPSTALTAAQTTAQETSTGISGHTRTGFGKHGFRFTEAGHLKGPESAELYDAPQLGTANDSEQVFESTALAIEGAQKDTYYGSVTWGWNRDAAGKFSMVPFKALSQGTPSVNFLTAASIFNTATEDFNWGVSVASANLLDAHDLTRTKATVTRGTALNWGGSQGVAGGVTYNVVTLKDGTSGLLKTTEMAMMDVGRPTVHLPVDEVYTLNVASVPMVSDPAKADKTVVKTLPKDTRVATAPPPTGVHADPAWSFVRVVDGPDTNVTGWVKKASLTREALGTH